MSNRPPITDHYGTVISVQPLIGSTGPAVDVERSLWDPATGKRRTDFDRLTPEQALDLADRLREAAESRA